MVVVGDTETEPPATGVTDPTPLSIEALEAFALVHDRVDDEPVEIEEGVAVNVPVGAGKAEATCVRLPAAS